MKMHMSEPRHEENIWVCVWVSLCMKKIIIKKHVGELVHDIWRFIWVNLCMRKMYENVYERAYAWGKCIEMYVSVPLHEENVWGCIEVRYMDESRQLTLCIQCYKCQVMEGTEAGLSWKIIAFFSVSPTILWHFYLN